jgi:hypothetical protein
MSLEWSAYHGSCGVEKAEISTVLALHECIAEPLGLGLDISRLKGW